MSKPGVSSVEQRLYWQRHVAMWQSSGERIEVYCQQARLCVKQFRAWRQRFRQEHRQPHSHAGPTLIPIEVNPSTAPSSATPATSGITIRLATGVAIEVSPDFDAPTLVAVMQALGSDHVLA